MNMGKLDPLLSALDDDFELPTSQGIANGAIIVVFAYLVPLLTMEINFFRLAVYKSWRRQVRVEKKNQQQRSDVSASVGMASVGADIIAASAEGDGPIAIAFNDDEDCDNSSSSSSVVGHLLNDVTSALHDTTQLNKSSHRHTNDPTLQSAYDSIRIASMQAILSSLVVYSLTAVGISLNTRGLDEKVIAIIVGASQFMTALMVFIVSAKVPQWIGVYHQGAIRLVKCSSNYSTQFEKTNLNDTHVLQKLRSNVRLGVWFHFSKFYIVLMPFYCGVQEVTIPLSIVCGGVFGFILMWAVFVVHEKYNQHRNIVSFTTILLLSVISALTFTRGIRWIQAVWKLNMLKNEDLLLVISFFAWLGLLAAVHSLFIWHTLRTEESNNSKDKTEQEGDNGGENELGDSRHSSGRNTPKRNPKMFRRNSSYSSFVFDPRTHFVDGKCQFSEHPDLEEDCTNESTDAPSSDLLPIVVTVGSGEGGQSSPCLSAANGCEDDEGVDDQDEEEFFIETPVVAEDDIDGSLGMDFADDGIDNTVCTNNDKDEGGGDLNPANNANDTPPSDEGATTNMKRHRPAWCEVFICFSPEYQQSSCIWKTICWIKIFLITLAYLLCLYFVIVSIGATAQISSTKAGLPAVQEAIYNHQNEGPVCGFDNRGPDSKITTFESKEAAHDAGFLVVHCGACGACSNWENLIVEYTTRNDMAALASECAKTALFGGGDDALTECLMEPDIGFGHECAVCWMEDILCTRDNCVFIYLQSQMINNVGNFEVGPDAVTGASCEEAHCEVGQFVPCSGATRRRMNITSSISRPRDQQCAIVDVKDWEDLFFGSGVA